MIKNPYDFLKEFKYWIQFATDVHGFGVKPEIVSYIEMVERNTNLTGRRLLKVAHFMLAIADKIDIGDYMLSVKMESLNCPRIDLTTYFNGDRWESSVHLDIMFLRYHSLDDLECLAESEARAVKQKANEVVAANTAAVIPKKASGELLREIRKAARTMKMNRSAIWLFDNEVADQLIESSRSPTIDVINSVFGTPYEIHIDSIACLSRAAELVRTYDEVWVVARMYGQIQAVNASSLISLRTYSAPQWTGTALWS